MDPKWFEKSGWFYRPVSLEGWFLTTLAFVFCIEVVGVSDQASHSFGGTLYRAFPYLVSTLVVLGWIASRTSGGGDGDHADIEE